MNMTRTSLIRLPVFSFSEANGAMDTAITAFGASDMVVLPISPYPIVSI
jgi:hypothetical protein